MNQTKKNWIVGILITTGPILVGLTAVQTSVNAMWPKRVPAVVWTFIPIAGLFILGLGVLLWLIVRIPIPTLMPAYECYRAKKSELELIRDYGVQWFGNEVSPLNRMSIWFERNKNIFTVMYRVKRTKVTKSRKFVGYYSVIPITEPAVVKLKSNEITGAGFLEEHIEPSNVDPYAIYVGAIVAQAGLARGNIRSALHNEITNVWATKTKRVFTRPVSKHGLRLVEDYGFTAVDPANSGKLQSLYAKELD